MAKESTEAGTLADTGARNETGIAISDRRCCGHILLNRPKALNALNDAMRAELAPHYDRWARDPMIYAVAIEAASGSRAFCAGGDIREMLEAVTVDPQGARDSLAREYAMNVALDEMQRPHVSLIDGAVMGSGVGITQFGTHRVAGPRYRFAMPEVAIGFVPDVGASWFLSRLPDNVGLYLALTARSIERADAFALGLATHCIAPELFAEIIAGLADADPIDDLLDDRHVDPGPAPLAPYREFIRRAFSAGSVEGILQRLEAAPSDHAQWAAEAASDIRRHAPLAVKVAHRLVSKGRGRDLRGALELEYRAAVRLQQRSDFSQGVRALVIDKTRNPAWSPGRLEDVAENDIDALLAPLESGPLPLPPRKATPGPIDRK